MQTSGNTKSKFLVACRVKPISHEERVSKEKEQRKREN